MITLRKSMLTTVLMFFSLQLFAHQNHPIELPQFYVKGGFSLGGSNLGTLEYNNGDEAVVTAGGGLSLGGGVSVPFDNFAHGVGINLSMLYHFDSATAQNADITFDRMEFSFMPYVQLNEAVVVSAGVEFHTGVELFMEFDGYEESYDYEASTAIAAEMIFIVNQNFYWSLKATSVDYTLDSYNEKVSGSNIGGFLMYRF